MKQVAQYFQRTTRLYIQKIELCSALYVFFSIRVVRVSHCKAKFIRIEYRIRSILQDM
jgi:hypothetical protein